jgi:hypothetical protein
MLEFRTQWDLLDAGRESSSHLTISDYLFYEPLREGSHSANSSFIALQQRL